VIKFISSYRSLLILPGINFLLLSASFAADLSPKEIVKKAIEFERSSSSYTNSELVIHRPEWERKLSVDAWTKGNKKTLVRFTAPAKEFGNATLTVNDSTWSFSPKVNRVIQIPPSMKTQSWMGSDFSYRDLSKTDDVVEQYNQKLLEKETINGVTVYKIELLPLENAPVVWGREIMRIRTDNIILTHQFYDQDGQLVKALVAQKIQPIGGKLYATVLHMENFDKKGNWTELRTYKAKFDGNLPDSRFTQSSLSNPRD